MHPAWYINVFLAYTLQGLLFWRGHLCGLYRRYQLFYLYLLYATLWSITVGIPYVRRHPAYPQVFWLNQLVFGVLRLGIAAEIYRHVFPKTCGLRQRAGMIVAIALMLFALMFWAIGPSPTPSAIFDSLRKISLSVAACIMLVLGLARYYGIQVGRNIWGMAIGLLLFMGSELVRLAAFDAFPRFLSFWRIVHPITFVLVLMIWTWALWNYSPNPRVVPLEERTRRELLAAWEDRREAIAHILRKIAKP